MDTDPRKVPPWIAAVDRQLDAMLERTGEPFPAPEMAEVPPGSLHELPVVALVAECWVRGWDKLADAFERAADCPELVEQLKGLLP